MKVEVKVDLHQGCSTESTVVYPCKPAEARNGLPSELLYADDLVIMAPTMEELGRRVADWSASLLGKGLKVNSRDGLEAGGWKQWWEDDCKLVESGPVLSVGKEYRQTLFSAQYVKKMDSQTVQWCAW